MTTKKSPLDAVDEAIFAEIMAASDAEVIAEVGDTSIAKGFAVLEGAKQTVARQRFLEAKAALEADRVVSKQTIG